MSTPFTSWTFTGDVTVDGEVSDGTMSLVKINNPLSDSTNPTYNLQGDKLTITMDAPMCLGGGQFVNVLNDVDGHITGTMNVAGCTVTLDGTGSFN